METIIPITWGRRSIIGIAAGLFLVLLATRALAADLPPEAITQYQPTNGEFSAVSKAVVELLQSRDTNRFAQEMSPSIEDWKSILSVKSPPGEDPLKGFQDSVVHDRQKAAASAKAFLAKLDALHVDFAKGDLHPRISMPTYIGSTHYSSLQADGETLPWTEKLEITLNPDFAGNGSTNGEYKLTLRGLIKFPGGWRSYGGIQWEVFPAGVADEQTRRELAILKKINDYEPLTGQDDPALLKLGDALVHFIRERDAGVYEKEALIDTNFGNLIWAQFQNSGHPGPSRKEFDDHMNEENQEQLEIARSLVRQMDDAGVDLRQAEIQIQAVQLDHCQSQGTPGSLDGLIGSRFHLSLAVKSDDKARNGMSLSGNYVLGVNQILRYGDDWKVAFNIRWEKLPDGVLDEKAAANLEFENYVAEHGTLPFGTDAPEISFTTLEGEKKMKLSDLRGKVIVLDFWATWCGPCQGPMADLQKIRLTHADWGDKVVVIPLSIDDTLAEVRDHVDKRGWTNTFNVWAGDGGWHSAPAKAFRVTGVPTTYVINAEGKVVVAGHPVGLRIGETVDNLLKSAH